MSSSIKSRSKPESSAAAGSGSRRSPSQAAPQPAASSAVSPAVQAAAATESAIPRELWIGLRAALVSTVAHVVLMVGLGLLLVPTTGRSTAGLILAEPAAQEETPREDLLKIELEENLQAATELTQALFTATLQPGAEGAAASTAERPPLSEAVMEEFDEAQLSLKLHDFSLPSTSELFESLPEGALGDPRAIVDDYSQALDRITEEIMWMLDQGDVLVVWCFDQSESMKDDQQEIRQRIRRIYDELGLSSKSSGDHLTTAVTSYGEHFVAHSRQPTSQISEIQTAIDAVPVDPSGKEIMCEAVGSAIARYRPFARQRQMALILVTDESGESENNQLYLERAIAEAKAAKCRVYTLGREAVFGYPLAYMRYKHPETQRNHWLPVDRGPETAFVEQLQTDGFRRRHDAFSSGFGPYEQTRLSRETGGVFFMLPTVEVDIVQRQKRRFELEAMTAYRPDLRSRLEVIQDRDRYPLRTAIWKVIHDLNPHNPLAQRSVELRLQFSLATSDFVQQVRTEQQKAKQLIQYLAWAEEQLLQAREIRDQEPSRRWQANYDLILAQLVAYQGRLYEYGVGLEAYLRDPPTAPLTRDPNLKLARWDIRLRKETRSEESQPYIERSRQMYEAVIQEHPGTPWAERAKDELARGFGVGLVPDYDPPFPTVRNPKPLPKL